MKFTLGLGLFLLLFAFSVAAQCPTVKATGPPGPSRTGENVVFRAEIGFVGTEIDYFWSVDKGVIVEGQGTTKIAVFADWSVAGQTITANIDVTGLPESCNGTASAVAVIEPRYSWHWEDSWLKLKPNDIRGRLDTLFASLTMNPTQVGFIQLLVTPKERLSSRNGRIQFILKHARYRKFDKRQLWFALEVAEEPMTSYIRVEPESRKNLPCRKCLIIKGEHL